jgi:hypothetical protein
VEPKSRYRRAVGFGSIAVSLSLLVYGLASGLGVLLAGWPNSSGLLGVCAACMGLGWLIFGLPRHVTSAARSYLPILVAQLAAFLLPLSFLPVVGTWLVSSPSRQSVVFAAAWASIWLASLVVLYSARCPVCTRPYMRRGLRPLFASLSCAHCGVGPETVA